ncbi:MAG: SDR family oxidoreductase [Bdellovibrionota bacterium]
MNFKIMLLENRNILVCGASGLIGRAVVETCTQEGAIVTGVSRSTEPHDIDLCSATFFPLEISVKTRAKFQEIIEHADPPFDGLVNCIGYWWGPGALSVMKNFDIERHLALVSGALAIYSALTSILSKIDTLVSFVQVNGVGAAKDIPGSTSVSAQDAYIDRLFTGEAKALSFDNIEMVQLAIHGRVSESEDRANFSAAQIGRAIACLLSQKEVLMNMDELLHLARVFSY